MSLKHVRNRFRGRHLSFGAAVATGTGLSTSSQAAIQWSGILNETRSHDAYSDTLFLDLNKNGTKEVTEGEFEFQSNLATIRGTNSTAGKGDTNIFFWSDVRFSSGVPIDGERGIDFVDPNMNGEIILWSNDDDHDILPLVPGESSLLPFRFVDEGSTYYGWMELTLSADAAANQGVFTLNQWAWNDESGGTILAGAIPEPSTVFTVSLVALGLGAAAWRKRRSR